MRYSDVLIVARSAAVALRFMRTELPASNNSRPRHAAVSAGIVASLHAAVLRDASFVGMTARVLQDVLIHSRSTAVLQSGSLVAHKGTEAQNSWGGCAHAAGCANSLLAAPMWRCVSRELKPLPATTPNRVIQRSAQQPKDLYVLQY